MLCTKSQTDLAQSFVFELFKFLFQLFSEIFAALCVFWTWRAISGLDVGGALTYTGKVLAHAVNRTVARKFSIGGLCVRLGGLDIIILTKTPLIYSVSRFNLGGLSPPKPPWRRNWQWSGYAVDMMFCHASIFTCTCKFTTCPPWTEWTSYRNTIQCSAATRLEALIMLRSSSILKDQAICQRLSLLETPQWGSDCWYFKQCASCSGCWQRHNALPYRLNASNRYK